MLKPHALCSSLLLIIASLGTALAQNETVKSGKADDVTVTAAATGARVRLAAFPSIAQIGLEVYDAVGKKVFDLELRGGNVLDWHLEDEQAQALPDNTYLCVVTARSLSGKLTRRIASVKIVNGSATVDPADPSQLAAQQIQAVGLLDETAAVTVLKEGEKPTTTIVAHDGEDGQIIRGKGALSFRIGDFYSGNDSEQMRLTAEGNLGIGLTHPQAKLDVDGLIRASQGIMFPDGTIQYSAATKTYDAKSSLPDPLFQSLGSKLGKKSSAGQEHIEAISQDMIPKFQDNGGTLTNSSIYDNGSIGIGTTSPIVKLDVNGALNLRVANLYLNGALRFTDSAVYTNFVAKNGNLTNFDGVNYEQLNLYNPGGDKAIHLGQTVAGSEISSIGTGNTNLALQPSGGIVSIGTNAPATKLDVNGDINTSTQYSIGGSRVLSTTGIANLFVGASAGFSNTTGTNNTAVGAFASVGSNLGNATAIGANAVVGQSNSLVLGSINGINGATADTNVGIRTTTPGSRLHVNGTSWFQGDNTPLPSSAGAGIAVGTVGGGHGYVFSWDYGAAAPRNLLLNSPGGNVGIGTTSPAERLHVGGNAYLNNNGGTNLYLEATGVAGGRKWRWVTGTASQSYGVGNGFGLFDDTAGAYRLVVDDNGNVGIGTTSGNRAVLHVDGGSGNNGVYATTTVGVGVFGESTTTFTGVWGASKSGVGVVASTFSGNTIMEGYSGSFRKFHIDNNGSYIGGSDFAEALPAYGKKSSYEAGDVLVVSAKSPGTVEKSSRRYDQRLVGVYSTRPAVLGADKSGTSRVDPDELPVAIVGIVPTKVSTENGPVQAGDLLTSSSTVGYAMKASPVRVGRAKIYRPGTILGKALQPLEQGKGVIKVLVTLR